ncbi:MAG: AAA family ATPase [Xanthobacteraceae bacterium]|nr:AAA family ATPase [Xanthobacteraceae bacterium]
MTHQTTTHEGTPDAATQRQVLAFLADPATHGGVAVRRIDTHAAVVFLAGDRALKVKRAVRFPFLDYSTLARRKAACDEEIRINRPAAPQIYRRVAAITRSDDGALRIDGDGTPVEYAVDMARFDVDATLEHLAEAGRLEPELIAGLVEAIAVSHRDAPVAAAEGWIASIPSIVAANTAAFRASRRLPEPDIDALDAACRSAFTAIRACLEARGRRGLVRRCHGDLHLANIVRIGRKPVLFDAIEFDPAIASVDVLYDLSFTLMDLLHHQRRSEANSLLNGYLAATLDDNLDGLAALPLFMSMRAAIRAHVLLARLSATDNEETPALVAARGYFALALGLMAPPRPMLVAVGGLSGTGKTLLARALAESLDPPPGAVVLRSDVARKQHFHVGEMQRLPADAYRPEINAIVYRILTGQAEQILAQRHSTILDAVFAKPAERLAAADVARKLDVPFAGLFLVSDLATRASRVERRAFDASDATVDLVRQQQDYDIGQLDWHVIDASGTPAQTLQRAQAALGLTDGATSLDLNQDPPPRRG